MSKPDLKLVPKEEPTMAELALAAANQVDVSANKAEDALGSLRDQDKEINDAVETISGLQGKAKEQAIKAISVKFGDMLVGRLSTMLLNEDVRGRYLSSKKGEITSCLGQISEIKAGAEGKLQLNRLVNEAIIKGFIEGAQLSRSGDPDMGSLRFPTVRNKVVGDQLRKLRDAAVNCESACINDATSYIKGIKNPRDLAKVIPKLAAQGWVEMPLPRNEKRNIQFQRLQAPAVLNGKLSQKLQNLIEAIKRQPREISKGRKKKAKK